MIEAFLFLCAFIQLYWLYRLIKKSDEYETRIKVLEARQPEPEKRMPTLKEAKKQMLGAWAKTECAVKDKFGKHCPETPVHEVDGLHLCERCFLNYQFRNKKKQFGEKLVEGFNPTKPETLRPNQVRGREVEEREFEFDVKIQ